MILKPYFFLFYSNGIKEEMPQAMTCGVVGWLQTKAAC